MSHIAAKTLARHRRADDLCDARQYWFFLNVDPEYSTSLCSLLANPAMSCQDSSCAHKLASNCSVLNCDTCGLGRIRNHNSLSLCSKDLHLPANLPGQPQTRARYRRGNRAGRCRRRQLQAVPTLLEVLCEFTGMRFAAVARVSESTWTACVVKDDIGFGLVPGGQLDLETTLCIESKRSNAPIVIEQASTDRAILQPSHAEALQDRELHIGADRVGDGRYFGNLCAIDPAPAKVADPKIISMFTRFAALIAMQLDSEMSRQDGPIPAARRACRQ